MIKKLIIILLSIVLVANFTVSAQNIISIDENKEKNKSFFYEDVPIWEVDDYWIYDIETLNLQVVQYGNQINLNLRITDFKSKVTSITASVYNVELSGNVRGSFLFADYSGLTFGGDFIFTKMLGDMQVRKSDLSALSGQVIIKAIALIKENPLGIPLPLIFTITVSLDHNLPRPFIDFPLYDGKIGYITEITPNIEIKIESFILKILNKLIPDIPAEIIFPFEISSPIIPYNVNQESINLKPGVFDAYNVDLGLGLVGTMYYAPDIGNIVKIDIDLDIPYQYKIKFNAELNDFTYQ